LLKSLIETNIASPQFFFKGINNQLRLIYK